jgi:hypothetical protein
MRTQELFGNFALSDFLTFLSRSVGGRCLGCFFFLYLCLRSFDFSLLQC